MIVEESRNMITDGELIKFSEDYLKKKKKSSRHN